MYIAMKYIGRDYTPGEIVPDDLPEEEIKWLKEAGAIYDTAPLASMTGQFAARNVGGTPDVNNGKQEEPAEEPQEESAAEDVEPEAPVIDVMDGIVDAPSEPEKPKKKRGKRK